MLIVEHSVLPLNSPHIVSTNFKAISIMGVFDKELEMALDSHVNDDWRIVHDVMMQILQIYFLIAKFFDPAYK